MKTIFYVAAAMGILLAATVEGRAYGPNDIPRPKPRMEPVCRLVGWEIVCGVIR